MFSKTIAWREKGRLFSIKRAVTTKHIMDTTGSYSHQTYKDIQGNLEGYWMAQIDNDGCYG